MSGPKSTKIKRICEICQNQFLVKPSRIGISRFCSRTCQGQSKRISMERRFHRHIGPKNENGCIIWTGTRNDKGYGAISWGTNNRGKREAHRVAWELSNGPIPDGLCVLHRCDVRSCVAIEHLFLGTKTDNNADRVSKNRSAKGENNGSAKLTHEVVRQIRERYAVGGIFQYELASEYGMAQSNIGRIVRREIWAHVP